MKSLWKYKKKIKRKETEIKCIKAAIDFNVQLLSCQHRNINTSIHGKQQTLQQPQQHPQNTPTTTTTTTIHNKKNKTQAPTKKTTTTTTKQLTPTTNSNFKIYVIVLSIANLSLLLLNIEYTVLYNNNNNNIKYNNKYKETLCIIRQSTTTTTRTTSSQQQQQLQLQQCNRANAFKMIFIINKEEKKTILTSSKNVQ